LISVTLEEILLLLNTALPLLINTAETIFSKPKSGIAKKAAVMGTAQRVLAANGAKPNDVNVEVVSGVVEETLADMKTAGTLGVISALPASTLVAAVAAAHPWSRTGSTFEGDGSSHLNG
jgi:hypothetical protein